MALLAWDIGYDQYSVIGHANLSPLMSSLICWDQQENQSDYEEVLLTRGGE